MFSPHFRDIMENLLFLHISYLKNKAKSSEKRQAIEHKTVVNIENREYSNWNHYLLIILLSTYSVSLTSFTDVARQHRFHSLSLIITLGAAMGRSVSSFAHSHAESQPCLWQKEYPVKELRRLDSQWVIKSDWRTNRSKHILNVQYACKHQGLARMQIVSFFS